MSRIRLVAILLAASLLLGASAAHGASSGLVLSQVYGGGGNTGATYTHDFVELFNHGSTAVDLSGWTVQYASATSTSWQATALSGTIQPGHYYLVQLASSASIGAPLPTPDATGTSNLAVSGGKIALVHDTAALTCGGTLGSCSAVSAVEDLVGYGSASDYEGLGVAAPALSSTTAALRADGGCTDTNVNSADFSTAAPAPRNSASPAGSCGGGPQPGVSGDTAVEIDVQPVLSIALERSSLSFGTAVAGDRPAPIGEHVTVVSNNAAGYVLTVHRTAFAPADLPLGIAGSAPPGTQLGAGLVGGLVVPIPVAPVVDLLVGSSSGHTADGGDVWPTSIGFAAPLPIVPPGRYAATVTYTLVGR
jgi:Lamin Tail Domain